MDAVITSIERLTVAEIVDAARSAADGVTRKARGWALFACGVAVGACAVLVLSAALAVGVCVLPFLSVE